MADQWWDTSRSNKYETGTTPSSSGLNSFGWQTDMANIKSSRTSFDAESVSGSSGVFQDAQKLQQGHDPSSTTSDITDPNLHMMGLCLSSQAVDWNQTLLREGKAETGFRSMLQENTSSFQQDHTGGNIVSSQWRERLFAGSSSDSSSVNEFKNINRGFSLDQHQFVASHSNSSESAASTCQGLPSASLYMDSSYGSPSPHVFQGLLGSENQAQQPPMNFPYQVANYSMNTSEFLHPNLSRSVPQFLRNSPPKQQPHHCQFHISNNAPYWNTSAATMNDIRPSFFPSLQTQFSAPNFEEKPKNISDVRDSGVVMKKSGSESATSSKRPRNDQGPSTLPAFKVRKEKMGDRITALQQLVSPFGKTDTASVLSEAIEYIKFLHGQVNALSTPYMKSGAQLQNQQSSEKVNDPEGPKQDLRSRGLCLVPISSTFPVTHETTVDFWTPTFGGTYR